MLVATRESLCTATLRLRAAKNKQVDKNKQQNQKHTTLLSFSPWEMQLKCIITLSVTLSLDTITPPSRCPQLLNMPVGIIYSVPHDSLSSCLCHPPPPPTHTHTHTHTLSFKALLIHSRIFSIQHSSLAPGKRQQKPLNRIFGTTVE